MVGYSGSSDGFFQFTIDRNATFRRLPHSSFSLQPSAFSLDSAICILHFAFFI